MVYVNEDEVISVGLFEPEGDFGKANISNNGDFLGIFGWLFLEPLQDDYEELLRRSWSCLKPGF